MNLKKLFDVGVDFEIFMKLASEEEKAQINEILRNLKLDESFIQNFASKDKLNILISAESWCPYARVTVATLHKLSEVAKNVEIRIITEGRGFMFLRSKLEISEDDYVIPTIALLDKDGEFVNSYIGKPQKYELRYFAKIKTEFFEGKHSNDILEEILNKYN